MSGTDIENFTIDECLEFLGQEKKWKKLSGSDLEKLFLKAIFYTWTPNPSDREISIKIFGKILALYPFFTEKVSISNRWSLAGKIRDLIVEKKLTLWHLCPLFIWKPKRTWSPPRLWILRFWPPQEKMIYYLGQKL